MSIKEKVSFWLKVFKKPIKKFANEVLIPLLQEKIDGGAIDEHIDGAIADGINEAIDKL